MIADSQILINDFQTIKETKLIKKKKITVLWRWSHPVILLRLQKVNLNLNLAINLVNIAFLSPTRITGVVSAN